MAIRFDTGQVLNPHETDDGILLCDAVFARDGVLEYKDSRTGKTRREFRPPEENQRALASFGLASLTLEHPSGLVDEKNAADVRKGISLQHPQYVLVPGKGGFVQGQIAVLDKAAQSAVKRKDASELSAGYKCRIEEAPGIWVNPATGQRERYDAIQRDIEVNHIALTRLGRAGPDVKVLGRFDSDDDLAYQIPDAQQQEPPAQHLDSQKESMTTTPVPMATLNLPGGSAQVPQDVFNVISPLLSRHDSETTELKKDLDEAEERADAAEASADDLKNQVEYKDGAIAALKDRLDAAESILDAEGYTWDKSAADYRSDEVHGKKKKKGKKVAEFFEDLEESEDGIKRDMSKEDMDDENDDDYDDDYDDEMPPKSKKKGKKDSSYKKDSADIRRETLNLLQAVRDAESMGVHLTEEHFDSISTPADVRRIVLQELRPQINLDDKSDAYIEARYDAIAEDMGDEPVRADSNTRQDYASEMSAALGSAGRSRGSGLEAARQASAERRMSNYKSSLTATKGEYGRRR